MGAMAVTEVMSARGAGRRAGAVLMLGPEERHAPDVSWDGLVDLVERSFAATRIPAVRGLHPARPLHDLAIVMVRDLDDLRTLDRSGGLVGLASRLVLLHVERPAADADVVDMWSLTPSLAAFDLVVTTVPSAFADKDLPVVPIAPPIDGSMLMMPIDARRPLDLLVPGRVGLRRRRFLTEWAARTGLTCDVVGDGRGDAALPAAELHDLMTAAKFVLLDDPFGLDRNDRAALAGHGREHGSVPGVAIVDALAAGCGVVGRLPVAGPARMTFGGLPGLFDLGPMPIAMPHAVEALMTDPVGLARMSAAHRAEALRHHDIAHRVMSLLLHLDAPVPDHLMRRIHALRALAGATIDRAERRQPGTGVMRIPPSDTVPPSVGRFRRAAASAN